MDKFYSVRSVRVTTPWFGTRKFYQPLGFDSLTEKYHCLQDVNEMTSVWGYDSEDEAWSVIDAQIHQDYCDEAELDWSEDRVDSGREDFHADG